MKLRWVNIVGIAAVLMFVGAGASFAGGYRHGDSRPYGHAYGHHRPHAPHYYAPGYYHGRPAPRYPVVVERHYYPAPPVYYSPGTFFGMSMGQPGVSFGFGIQSR